MPEEFIASEAMTIHDLGNNEFGLVYEDNLDIMEIWYNHNFDGCGCNNLQLTAFGRELDLEFCRSKRIS